MHLDPQVFSGVFAFHFLRTQQLIAFAEDLAFFGNPAPRPKYPESLGDHTNTRDRNWWLTDP